MKSQIDQFPKYFPGNSRSLLSNFDQHDIDSDSVRTGLRFLPSDRLEINLTANYSTVDQAGPTRKTAGPGGLYYTPDAALLPNYENAIHDNLVEDPGFWKSDIWGVTGRIDRDFNDTMTFTSLTSFREVDSELNWVIATENVARLRLSTGTVPLAVYGSNDYVDDSETFTQEFRRTSPGSGPFQWVGGLYYLNEETYRDETVPAGLLVPDGDGGALVLVPAADAGDKQDNTTDSYAIFGQVTWDITDKLAITAGGRQDWEEKKISRLRTPNGLAPARIFDFSTSEDWSAFTAKGGIEFQATDDLFFYATVCKGFKSGGYQGSAATELAAITPFEPEGSPIGTPGQWVIGMGYDDSLIEEQRHPERSDLDAISSEHPIALIHVSGHLTTVNSMALDVSGIAAETPDPPGGMIRRQPGSNEPNGVMEETATAPLRHIYSGGYGGGGGRPVRTCARPLRCTPGTGSPRSRTGALPGRSTRWSGKHPSPGTSISTWCCTPWVWTRRFPFRKASRWASTRTG